MRRWIKYVPLFFLLAAPSAALSQYPGKELSFTSFGDYITEYVGGTEEEARRETIKELPLITCLGIGTNTDTKDFNLGYEPPIEVQLNPRATAALSAFRTGNYLASVELIRPAALESDPQATYVLGCIMEGLARAKFSRRANRQVPPHPQRVIIDASIEATRQVGGAPRPAHQWLIASAERGFVPAQWELARRWSRWDVLYPQSIAIDWIKRLSAAGDRRGRALLGFLYLQGASVPKDVGEAVRLIRSSAEASDPLGMLMLANLYREGRGLLRDDRASVEWLERLSRSGDKDGQYYLGLALRDGTGTARDTQQAARLFAEAADQGHADAAYQLAMLYTGGAGLAADPELANKWLGQAIELKSCPARLERAERRVAAGDVALGDEAAATALLDELSRCHPALSSGRAGPGERRINVVERARWYERVDDISRKLGRGGLDREHFRAALSSPDPQAATQAVALLAELARKLVEQPPGAGVHQRDDAVEALAILAFPARWLPEAVQAQIDNRPWRQRFDSLTPDLRSSVLLAGLSNPLVRPDIAALLAVLEELGREGNREPTEIFRRIGLSGAGFVSLLKRLDRGEEQDKVELELRVMTFNCTSTHLFARFVARMRAVPPSCSNVEGLAQLSTAQLQRIADLGSAEALMYLAERYLEGRGVQRDPARAVRTLEELRGALPEAMLGAIFQEGRGIAPDPARAAAYYQRFIDEKYVPSRSVWNEGWSTVEARFGIMLLEGQGVAPNAVRASGLLQSAAMAGVLIAETRFGDALYVGEGVSRDEDEAVRWYRQAAAAGDASALVRFGFLAETGRRRERGLRAELWYGLAEQADMPGGYLDLARAEVYGPKARAERAGWWLRRAAQKNDMWAAGWLRACPTGSPACLRLQPGFAQLFFIRLDHGLATPTRRTGRTMPSENPADLLVADLKLLRGEAIVAADQGAGRQVLGDILEDRERLQTYHGDAEAALATRVRRVLTEDAVLHSQYGSLQNYFALLDSSCNWGRASEMAQRLGRDEAALFLAKVAVNRLQEARAYLEGVDEEIRECFLEAHRDRYRWLADLLIRAERLAEAETVLAMLKDFEHASYTRDAARLRSSRRELSYSPRERAILARMDRLRAAAGDVSDTAARSTPAAAAGGPGTSMSEAQLHDEIDAALREVAAMDLQPGRPRSGIRVEQIARAQRSIMVDLTNLFPPKTVALHSVVLEGRMHWLITTRRGRDFIRIDGPSDEIDRAITDLLEAIETRAPYARARAKALYDRVFAPVDRELRRMGAQYVMLALDGRLRYVPFAALHDGEQWLVERYSFSHFQRPEEYLRGRPSSTWSIAAFGSSSAVQGHEALPGVAREVGDLVRTDDADKTGILPGIARLDGAFTRNALASGLASDFRLIHIASHFVLDAQEAEASYLLLGDGGRLSLRDIRRDGHFTFAHADLVTLSACQTAVAGAYGSGLEVDSMATIAQDAGAPAVIASLWSVADPSTADLMLGFYARRASGKLPLSEALRQAQLAMMRAATGSKAFVGEGAKGERKGYDHPYYWAPFIVMGNWQ